MSIKIDPFEPVHIDAATDLVTRRFRQLRGAVPTLPSRYERGSILGPMLKEICDGGSGVAAFEEDQLVGYLLAWTVPNFRGRQMVFSPEWANAALLDRAGPVYEGMMATAMADWYAKGSTSFIAALFANDHAAADKLFQLGFGMLAMDAMRDLSTPEGASADVKITRATLDDLEPMMALSTGLAKHLQAAPVFLLQFELPDRDELAADLQDETLGYFLAWQDGEPVAFLKIGPASEDASTIIRDEGTASITGAYAVPGVRGNGISTALLARCIEWVRDAGYERCSVDFEPTNIEANRFWRRHFQPVSFGVQRLLNIE